MRQGVRHLWHLTPGSNPSYWDWLFRSPSRHQLESPDPSLARALEWMRDVGLEDRVSQHVPAGRETGAHDRRAVVRVREIARRQAGLRVSRPRDTGIHERSERHREE